VTGDITVAESLLSNACSKLAFPFSKSKANRILTYDACRADGRGQEPTMEIKILVVDDDVFTLRVMDEVLSSLGVETRSVSDSREAATMIHKEKFDGIFLDLMMPNVDGFELARQVRQSSRNKRTPIVIITGKEDKKTVALAFEAGGTFFLHKPVDKARLTSLLSSTRGTMLQERRRSQRISFHNEVIYKIGPLKMSGMGYNLSFAGILFQAVSPLEPGSTVRLSFHLAKQESSIEVLGSVVDFDETMRAKIRFTQISKEDQQRIENFISSQVAAS